MGIKSSRSFLKKNAACPAAEEMLRSEVKDKGKEPMVKDSSVQRPIQLQRPEPALQRLTYPAGDGFGRGRGGQNRGSTSAARRGRGRVDQRFPYPTQHYQPPPTNRGNMGARAGGRPPHEEIIEHMDQELAQIYEIPYEEA